MLVILPTNALYSALTSDTGARTPGARTRRLSLVRTQLRGSLVMEGRPGTHTSLAYRRTHTSLA